MSDPAHIQFPLKPNEQAALKAYLLDFTNTIAHGYSYNGFVQDRFLEMMRDKGYFDPDKQKEIHERVYSHGPRS